MILKLLVFSCFSILQARIGEYCPAGYQFPSKGPNKNFIFIEDTDHYKFGYWRIPIENLKNQFNLNSTILQKTGWTLTFRLPGISKLRESESLIIQTSSGLHLNVAGDGLSFSLTSHPGNRDLLSKNKNIKSHFSKNRKFYYIYLTFYDEKNDIPLQSKKAFQKVTFHLGEYASTECMFIQKSYRMAVYDKETQSYVDIKKREPYKFGAPDFDGPGFQSSGFYNTYHAIPLDCPTIDMLPVCPGSQENNEPSDEISDSMISDESISEENTDLDENPEIDQSVDSSEANDDVIVGAYDGGCKAAHPIVDYNCNCNYNPTVSIYAGCKNGHPIYFNNPNDLPNGACVASFKAPP